MTPTQVWGQITEMRNLRGKIGWEVEKVTEIKSAILNRNSRYVSWMP